MLTKYLLMIFKAESGEKITLTVNEVKEGLTEAEISAAMDVIIAKDPFMTKGGSLVEKVSAQIVSKNVDEFEIA